MAVYRVIPVGDLELGPTNPATGKRSLVWLTDAQYARQKILTRLKFIQGEWFRDTREGVPWITEALVMNPDLNRIRTIFQKVILSVQEVTNVTSLVLDFNSTLRTLGVSFEASLVSGGKLLVRQPDPPFIITLPRAV